MKGGMGLDLGFTYQKMKGQATRYLPNSSKNGCYNVPYKYKLGVSIMDIGNVKFPDGDFLISGYNFDNYDWVNYANTDVNDDNVTTVLQDA
jgi:hypothetical protein